MVHLRFLGVPARRLCKVLRCFCRISRLLEVVQEEKSDKLTNFRSVEAAHSYVMTMMHHGARVPIEVLKFNSRVLFSSEKSFTLSLPIQTGNE